MKNTMTPKTERLFNTFGQNVADEKVEKFSKLFSLKLADKLERKGISLQAVNRLMVEFFNLLNSAGSEKEIKGLIEKI